MQRTIFRRTLKPFNISNATTYPPQRPTQKSAEHVMQAVIRFNRSFFPILTGIFVDDMNVWYTQPVVTDDARNKTINNRIRQTGPWDRCNRIVAQIRAMWRVVNVVWLCESTLLFIFKYNVFLFYFLRQLDNRTIYNFYIHIYLYVRVRVRTGMHETGQFGEKKWKVSSGRSKKGLQLIDNDLWTLRVYKTALFDKKQCATRIQGHSGAFDGRVTCLRWRDGEVWERFYLFFFQRMTSCQTLLPNVSRIMWIDRSLCAYVQHGTFLRTNGTVTM